MFGRSATAILAAVTLELIVATSAAAATVSYQDGVFRYRAQTGESSEIVFFVKPAKADGTPGRLSGFATAPVRAGPGCRTAPNPRLGDQDDIVCVLTAPPLPHYRLTLSDRDDNAAISGSVPLHGVIYTGPGSDTVEGATWRVYGGTGKDHLAGQRVYGGPGDDHIRSGVLAETGPRSVLRGGTGEDIVDAFSGPAWAYGGPGNDTLQTSPRRDMLVGGRGRDLIDFVGGDKAADTFRIRGGGHDMVFCDGNTDRDVFFADRADELDLCGDARVLFTGRPRISG
jgi:Ca2+-binding RTX toxin-like protein